MSARRSGRTAAYAAAALAFASAAISFYWASGGTGLLDTVGGEIEELARERSAAAVALIGATAVAKLLAGMLALALLRSERRPPFVVAIAGGALLALYGGALVLVGALVLAGAVDPGEPADEYALRWHVLVWDMWFLLWGLALAFAGRRLLAPLSTTLYHHERAVAGRTPGEIAAALAALAGVLHTRCQSATEASASTARS